MATMAVHASTICYTFPFWYYAAWLHMYMSIWLAAVAYGDVLFTVKGDIVSGDRKSVV